MKNIGNYFFRVALRELFDCSNFTLKKFSPIRLEIIFVQTDSTRLHKLLCRYGRLQFYFLFREQIKQERQKNLLALGAVFAVGVPLVLIIYQFKKDSVRQRYLQRIEETKKRKACPQRRKRAISKLIKSQELMHTEDWFQNNPQLETPKTFPFSRNDDSNECPICLEKFEVGQDLSWSQARKCQHTFHAECLIPWLMKHDDCPCCRATFIDEATLLEDEIDDSRDGDMTV